LSGRTGRWHRWLPSFARHPENLILLHNIGEAYGVRPSAILGMETPIGEIEIDAACVYLGRQAEKAISEGKEPLPRKIKPLNKEQNFVDPRRFKRAKVVKVKPDGTW